MAEIRDYVHRKTKGGIAIDVFDMGYGTSLEEAQDNKMSLICEKLQLKAGDSYLVPPGHLPTVPVDTVMVEFSQDPTYSSKEFIAKK